MALFKAELPTELIKEIEALSKSTQKMMGEMTRAGAEVVYKNVSNNIKRAFKDTSRLEKNLKITKTYETKSDDAINTKIAFYGYLENSPKTEHYPYGTPAPLVAMAREYGTSERSYIKDDKKHKLGHIDKKPFMRKSFKKAEIEEAMLKVQEKYIKNDEE